MRVLGIDPGLATTGYAVLESSEARQGGLAWEPRGGSARLLEAGVITTPAGQPAGKRLHTLYLELRRLIREFQPDALAIEELFFSENRTTAFQVAQARGVVLLAAWRLPVWSYTPLQVKLRICGYGRARKPQVQAVCQHLLRLETLPRPDDAADALAVALSCLLEARSPQGWQALTIPSP